MTSQLTVLKQLVTIQWYKLYCTSKGRAYVQIDPPSILLSMCLPNFQGEIIPMIKSCTQLHIDMDGTYTDTCRDTQYVAILHQIQ